MTEAYDALAKQLRLIQTSVNKANDMAHQLLRTEEDLFQQHLLRVLTEKDLPIWSREMYRYIKRRLHLWYGYRPDEREIRCGLQALGWEQHRVSRGFKWMPPSGQAPSTLVLHDHEQQQDPPPPAAPKPDA